MKGTRKLLATLLLILSLFACKKDKKEPFKPILRNGYYLLKSAQTPSVPMVYHFYLNRDDFYPARFFPNDSVCFSKSAGYVTKINDVITIPFLKPFSQSQICSVLGDDYCFYFYKLNFNQDQNSPQFIGYYIIRGDTVRCELYWIKD